VSTREGLALLEEQYGSIFLLRETLSKDTSAWQKTDTRTRALRGQLLRAYLERGMAFDAAQYQLQQVVKQIEVADQAGGTWQDWVTPVARASAHVVLRDSRGWFLMQLRSKDAPSSAGKWSVPGGKRLRTETPEQCAIRELFEETDLGPEHLCGGRLVPVGSYLDQKPTELVRRYLFYADTTAGDRDVVCREGDQMVFVVPHKIRGLDLTEEAVVGITPYLPPELQPDPWRELGS
jgi:8-oxo-dGTP pyrophosphatase MutT (NUDIX family)